MRGSFYLYAYGALFALMVLCVMFERAEPIDSIPVNIAPIAGVCGAVLGFLASAEARKRGMLKSGYRAVLWMAGLTFMGFVAAMIVGHSAEVRIAFAGTSTKTETALFDVVGSSRSRRKGISFSTRYSVTARLPGSLHIVRVRATRAVYDKIGKRPASGEYCIELPVRTGRWGVRAVWAPNKADPPLDVADLRPCGRSGAF